MVLSRLAYRKGIDLLVATAPRVCAAFPNVKFIIGMRSDTLFFALNWWIGGDGPKLNDLLQVRERHMLQDRMELLGSVRHRDVRAVRRQFKFIIRQGYSLSHKGPYSWINISQHVADGVIWHCYPGSCVHWTLRSFYSSWWCTRNFTGGHDLVR